MLKAKLIPQLLSQLNTDGVQSTILMVNNGALLGSAGTISTDKQIEARVIGAILANIWNDYETVGTKNDTGKLDCLMLNCENLQVAAVKVGTKYIAVCCGKDVELKMLRQRLNVLRASLTEIVKNLA